MNNIAYVVRVTREDGTWFYASRSDGPAELFNSREDAAEFREWLTEDIDPEMLEVKEVGVLIYEQ